MAFSLDLAVGVGAVRGEAPRAIAAILDREGFRPPKRASGFTAGMVRRLLHEMGLRARSSAAVAPSWTSQAWRRRPVTSCVTPRSQWNSCQPQSENETARPRIPLAVLTMIVYAFLSQIAIGEGRTGWSGDSAEKDSMMDLRITSKIAGWSLLRKRGKPIEDSSVQDPEQNAQMESLDYRASAG